jgi:hypothetical protein
MRRRIKEVLTRYRRIRCRTGKIHIMWCLVLATLLLRGKKFTSDIFLSWSVAVELLTEGVKGSNMILRFFKLICLCAAQNMNKLTLSLHSFRNIFYRRSEGLSHGPVVISFCTDQIGSSHISCDFSFRSSCFESQPRHRLSCVFFFHLLLKNAKMVSQLGPTALYSTFLSVHSTRYRLS